MPFEQNRLEEGQVIRADFLSGPAIVKKFEERPGYYKMEVVLSESGEFRSINATPDQLEEIELVNQILESSSQGSALERQEAVTSELEEKAPAALEVL